MKKALCWPFIFLCLISLSVFGDEAEDSFKKGVEKQNSGDLDGAWADFNNAIFLKPAFAEAYNARGVVRQTKGDAPGALADLDKAIELKPDYFEAFANRGNLKMSRADMNGAMTDLDKAIELKPNFAAYFSRARVKQVGGNLPGALADFEKVVELNPAFPGTYYYRGCLQYDQHSFANAFVDFQKVCQINPVSDYAHFRLWLVRSRLGEKDAATTELQAYLDHRPPGPLQGRLAKVSAYLTGKMPEADFLKAAVDDEQQKGNALEREAYFLAGTMHVINGDQNGAKDFFTKCVATDIKEDPDYQSAAAELKFLDAAK